MSEEVFGIPGPPSVEKKLRFAREQVIGMALLMLVPFLALLGAFGEDVDRAYDWGESLAFHVDYPARTRYRIREPLVITVENFSDESIPTVTVTIDTAYLSNFSEVTFKPSEEEITPDVYKVLLHDVHPGTTRQVIVEMKAERYWRHRGTVSASVIESGEVADVEVEVSTLVFP